MCRILGLATVVAAAGVLIASPRTNPPKPPDAGKFLFESIRDGLAEDGVPPKLARSLANNEKDFIVKCPICANSQKALSKYGERRDSPIAAKGKGLPADLAKRLNSEVDGTRRAALRDLVQRYIVRGYERAGFTSDERAAMQK
ncbi:MAG TPA: hypothetical protein VLM40_19010, partial [Gemmata sp.]|nr:hypothetical protein [Gemmata sp.]